MSDMENAEEHKNSAPEDNLETSDEREKIEDKTRRQKTISALKWTGALLPILMIAAVYFGVTPPFIKHFLQKSGITRPPPPVTQQWTTEEQELVNFIDLTLTETEQIWKKIFADKNGVYKTPKHTLFTDKIEYVCDYEQAASGTFYCPQEQRIYIDLSLYLDLKNRLDIPGDFAQGYVIAHGIGHHVQALAGISEQIPEARLLLSDKDFKMVLLRLELQADCFSGIWAKHTDKEYHNIEQIDIVDALSAVNRISHERLQRQTEEEITPDSLTHGSARQRTRWFMTGYNKGSFDSCDTFTSVDL